MDADVKKVRMPTFEIIFLLNTDLLKELILCYGFKYNSLYNYNSQ